MGSERAPDRLFARLWWLWRHRRCPRTRSGRHLWVRSAEPGIDRWCAACDIEA